MSITNAQSRDGFIWTPIQSRTGLRTKAVVPNSSRVHDNYDVIVIGSGFAGLIAARDLSISGKHSVLLIEARDRIGGRTWTADELGEDIEMGGTWVHWNQPHVYSELNRYGLHHNLKPTVASINPSRAFHYDGAQQNDTAGDSLLKLVQEISDKFFNIDGVTSRELMPYPHDSLRRPAPWMKYDSWSVKDRLDQLDAFQEGKDLFASYVSLFGCNDPAEIGFVDALRWYALSGHTMAGVYELTSAYKLGAGGMTSFARSILQSTRADRLFSTVVSRIDQSNSKAQITTTDGRRFTAQAVVCTIPLNCLQDIQFNPPLSKIRQEAAQVGHQNKGAKVHFKLSATQSLWFGTASVSLPSPYLLAFADHNGTDPAGPSGTYCVAAVKKTPESQLKDPAYMIKQFNDTFQPKSEVEAYLIHDWTNDQFSKGQWACWAAGAASAYLRELQKPHGRIFFGSADWANGWRGFIDGALESGKRAAQDAEILLDNQISSRL